MLVLPVSHFDERVRRGCPGPCARYPSLPTAKSFGFDFNEAAR
jgi:hypothetical protein